MVNEDIKRRRQRYSVREFTAYLDEKIMDSKTILAGANTIAQLNK